MRDRLILSALVAIGALVMGGFLLVQSGVIARADTTAPDGAGPNLVIKVDEYNGKPLGTVVIDLLPKVAPKAVERMVTLAKEGKYDGVIFHRVIDGFMAQTGDVEYGKHGDASPMVGMGGSSLPDLPAEFSKIPFTRGVVGMARAQDPNSANSQFFIMFAPAPSLNGQYTVVGRVVKGMDVVDKIRKGNPALNGKVNFPDYMASVTVEP